MNIIPASSSDARVLRLFAEHDDFMVEFLGEDRVYYTRYGDQEKLEKVWLVCEEGIPVGCVAYRKKSADAGEVKRLFIEREYRRRGYSKALLSAVEDYARGQNCQRPFLDTRITLEPAVSLYRQAGFEITFQQGLYVQMEKSISF